LIASFPTRTRTRRIFGSSYSVIVVGWLAVEYESTR
jgi:hypothetical protein